MSICRRTIITCLTLFAILLGTTSAASQNGHNPMAATPTAGSPQASPEWQIETITVVKVEGTPVSLSPDGRMLAGTGPDNTLCVWQVVNFEPDCDSAKLPILPDSIIWSPDSSAVAFSLDAFTRAYESDIYIHELSTGESMNLTDDGLEGGLLDLRDEASMPVDTTPAWSADSQSILFTRSDMGEGFDTSTTDLMSVSRAGGEPELLQTLYEDGPLAVYTQIFPLSDGSVVYALNPAKVSDAVSGVWLLSPDGEARQVMPAGPEAAFPMPIVTDVIEVDGTLMATGFSGYHVATLLDEPFAFLLDLNSGDVTPLAGDPGTMQIPAYTVFSPDGTTTLSTLFGPTEGDQVLLMGTQREEVDLGPGNTSGSAGSTKWRGPEWRDGNVVFLSRGALADPYLLTMASSQSNP
jgi:hypothetical protein